jgi:ubiquinone/menaquinone biosynthesis C-methylase UbiE
MGLEKQGSKPTGIIGKIIGRLMNKFHTSLYVDYFNKKNISENYRILDIGCGGGKFIKYLSQKSENFQLYGLDHSKEMIDLTSHLNKEAINQNRLKLIVGSVVGIDINDNSLDLVTAFETVQFWTDLNKAFSEIYRILDNNGEFLIINRYPKEGTKWWELANLKSEKDYLKKFENNKFKDISIDLNYKNGWIIVKGTKK